MQFELFEKHMSANYFKIEREKSCDYVLIIYIIVVAIEVVIVS